MGKTRPHGGAANKAGSQASTGSRPSPAPGAHDEEDMGLLAAEREDATADHDGHEASGARSPGLTIHTGHGADDSGHSLRTPKTPRTPNRVRFDLPPEPAPAAGAQQNGHVNGSALARPLSTLFDLDEQQDEGRGGGEGRSYGRRYIDEDDDDDDGTPGSPDAQRRLPLLTDIEAPSVALANSPWAGRGSGPGGDEEDDVHTLAEQERARPKSGLQSAFMNMANSIIGAGIIGQPYAFRQAGLLAGVVLLVVLTVLVDWTICLIVINSKLSGASSFQGTVEHCFGRPGLIAISLAQWVFAFGGMVAFGVIVGDSIPHVLSAVWPGLRDIPVLGLLADRRAAIVVFILGISYPLALYRDIAKLAKASTMALISMLVIVVTVVIQGALTPKEDRGSFSTPLLTVNSGIFQAIGVISFAFVCHHNSLLIYGSLKTPTIDRFSRVTHYSTGISMLACLLMALAGFLTFGDRTLGNVLNNFSPDNTMVNIARLCFGLNMLTTLPLEAFVCREVMLNYFLPGAAFNLKVHVAVTTGLIVGGLGLSLLTCDLGVIFELVGATSACAMAYILPPLCYIKLTTRSWKTYAAAGVVAFGSLVMCISIVQAVQEIITGSGERAQCV